MYKYEVRVCRTRHVLSIDCDVAVLPHHINDMSLNGRDASRALVLGVLMREVINRG